MRLLSNHERRTTRQRLLQPDNTPGRTLLPGAHHSSTAARYSLTRRRPGSSARSSARPVMLFSRGFESLSVRLGDDDRYRKETPGARQVTPDVDLAVLGVDHIFPESLGRQILPATVADGRLKEKQDETGRRNNSAFNGNLERPWYLPGLPPIPVFTYRAISGGPRSHPAIRTPSCCRDGLRPFAWQARAPLRAGRALRRNQ